MSTPVKDMKKIISTMKREQIILRLVALIILGAGINILFIGLTVWDFTHSGREPILLTQNAIGTLNNTSITIASGTVIGVIQNTPQTEQEPFQITQVMVTHYLMYFVLSIVYSVGASLAFKPKRFVSPFYIQMVTMGFFAIIITTPFLLYPNVITNESFVQGVFGITFVLFLLLILVGLIQSGIVRRIVALNEPFDNLDSITSIYNIKYADLKKILVDESFQSLGGFVSIRQPVKDKLILESRSRTDEKIILVLTPDMKDEKSIIAGFGYGVVYNTIIPSKSAKAWLESLFYFLEKQTGTPIKDDTNLSKTDAYVTAYRRIIQSTKPQITGIAYLPRYQITTLIVTGIIGALLTVAWQIFNFLDDSAYITTLVLILIELLIVFVPLMIDKSRKEIEV
jgi:hypothetical protein